MIEVPFRINDIDREIITLLKEGTEEKKIARKLKIPYKLLKQKMKKLQRLGLI